VACLVGDGLQLLDQPGRLVGSCGGELATARARTSHGKGQQRQKTTFEILGRQQNRAEMVVLDEAADLGRDLGAIPSHNQHLANGPAFGRCQSVTC
jgi:hypothetical protein